MDSNSNSNSNFNSNSNSNITKMSLQDALAITERIVVGFEALNNLNEVLIIAVNLEEDCRLLKIDKSKLEADNLTLHTEQEELENSINNTTAKAIQEFNFQVKAREDQIDELQTAISQLENKKNTLDRDITKQEKQREEKFLLELKGKEAELLTNVRIAQDELKGVLSKLEKAKSQLVAIKESL